MKFRISAVMICAMLGGCTLPVFAGNVRTDYNHQANFAQYHTYSWGNVKTSDPFYVDRIKQGVDKQLQAKGWQLVTSGASVTIFASDNLHNQKEVQTMYDGFGGGWGGGFGDATTTTSKQLVANLVVDLFDGNSKNLLWRGLATEDLSTNANKNTKSLDSDIARMFKDFPPK
jgi:hypothetical protein